tara:strand:- start:607 stop:753 length:147 start_codon:yes stop_codon:yes gene_type:complete
MELIDKQTVSVIRGDSDTYEQCRLDIIETISILLGEEEVTDEFVETLF